MKTKQNIISNTILNNNFLNNQNYIFGNFEKNYIKSKLKSDKTTFSFFNYIQSISNFLNNRLDNGFYHFKLALFILIYILIMFGINYLVIFSSYSLASDLGFMFLMLFLDLMSIGIFGYFFFKMLNRDEDFYEMNNEINNISDFFINQYPSKLTQSFNIYILTFFFILLSFFILGFNKELGVGIGLFIAFFSGFIVSLSFPNELKKYFKFRFFNIILFPFIIIGYYILFWFYYLKIKFINKEKDYKIYKKTFISYKNIYNLNILGFLDKDNNYYIIKRK